MQILNKSKIIMLTIIQSLCLFGCTSTPSDVLVMESDPAIQQLMLVAEDIATYERRLYQIESSRYIDAGKEKLGEYDMYFTPSLSQYHYLGDEWTGPLEPLLEKITELSGLNDIRYLNVKPANPIIIYVDTKSRRLIDILADSGYQARNRAKVTLKVKERLIQVEYPSNG
jgi:hypothetical protein